MPIKPWKRTEPTKVTKVGWRTIVSKTFLLPSGPKVVFDTFHSEGQQFASVVGLTPDNKVITVQHFVPGPEIVMNNLPGGYVDSNESIEAAAAREFQEETGYVYGPKGAEYAGVVYIDVYMNAVWHIFFAVDCVYAGDIKREVEEDMEAQLLEIDELMQLVKSGKTTHGNAYMLVYDRLMEAKK